MVQQSQHLVLESRMALAFSKLSIFRRVLRRQCHRRLPAMQCLGGSRLVVGWFTRSATGVDLSGLRLLDAVFGVELRVSRLAGRKLLLLSLGRHTVLLPQAAVH